MNKTVQQIFNDANITISNDQLNAVITVLGKDTLNVKDKFDRTEGISKELLCDERYWLKRRFDYQAHQNPAKYRFNNGTREEIKYNFGYSYGSSFLDIHDIFEHGDTSWNTDITEFDDSIIIVNEDNIPYVVEAFRHRFLNPDINYGDSFEYLNAGKNLSSIVTMGTTSSYKISKYLETSSINDLYNTEGYYSTQLDTVTLTGTNINETTVPTFKHPIEFEIISNGGYRLAFININKEVFSNGQLKFYPIVFTVPGTY